MSLITVLLCMYLIVNNRGAVGEAGKSSLLFSITYPNSNHNLLINIDLTKRLPLKKEYISCERVNPSAGYRARVVPRPFPKEALTFG